MKDRRETFEQFLERFKKFHEQHYPGIPFSDAVAIAVQTGDKFQVLRAPPESPAVD